MSKKQPIAIEVNGALYRLAKRARDDWEQEYTDREEQDEQDLLAKRQEYERDIKEHYREPWQQAYMLEQSRPHDPELDAVYTLLNSVRKEVLDRILDSMNSGELTEEVQQQLADMLEKEYAAMSMLSKSSNPEWFKRFYKKVEELTQDPNIFRVDNVKGLYPEGPISMLDLVLEIIKKGHLKEMGFTVGFGHDTYESVRRQGDAPPPRGVARDMVSDYAHYAAEDLADVTTWFSKLPAPDVLSETVKKDYESMLSMRELLYNADKSARKFVETVKQLKAEMSKPYQTNTTASAARTAPSAIRINGRRYRRADEGPDAEASDPEPMSNEAVFAADFGIPPDKANELKGFKNTDGRSLYDIIKESLIKE